jgi:hypothetical protein
MPDRNGVTHPKYGTCIRCLHAFEITVDGLIPPHPITVAVERGARLEVFECRGSDAYYDEYAGRCAEQRYLAAEARRRNT